MRVLKLSSAGDRGHALVVHDGILLTQRSLSGDQGILHYIYSRCHLPHDDQLPTLPVGTQHIRGSRSSVLRCSNVQSSTLNRPMLLEGRVEETVAQLSWTKLSPVN